MTAGIAGISERQTRLEHREPTYVQICAQSCCPDQIVGRFGGEFDEVGVAARRRKWRWWRARHRPGARGCRSRSSCTRWPSTAAARSASFATPSAHPSPAPTALTAPVRPCTHVLPSQPSRACKICSIIPFAFAMHSQTIFLSCRAMSWSIWDAKGSMRKRHRCLLCSCSYSGYWVIVSCMQEEA